MSKTPQPITHIAFIVDGNRRWAADRGLAKLEGHKAGYERLKEIAEACFDRGIAQVSAYIFSIENWNRQKTEVNYLMDLAYRIFTQDLNELHEKGIRIRFWGTRDKLSKKLISAIEATEAKTQENTHGCLNLCFNYGGQQEIVTAVQKLVEAGTAANKITQAAIKAHMWSHDCPPPDLIVRTSGEQRLSNFLLWDSAYAELSFLPVYWPDFDIPQLDLVLADYASRQRRYGR